jgi:hypothetical protein
MDRQEAERIYDAGKEAVVETLLKTAARIRELEKLEQRVIELEQIVARLTRNSSNSSRPPSSDPPGIQKSGVGKPRANAIRAANQATRARNGSFFHRKWWLKPTTSFLKSARAVIFGLRKNSRSLRQIHSVIRSLICP